MSPHFTNASHRFCRLPRSVFAVPLVVACLALAGSVSGALSVAADERSLSMRDFPSKVRPLLATHCLDCHGEGGEAGVDFTVMKTPVAILEREEIWRRTSEALATEHMPPEPADTDFTEADRKLLTEWIRQAVLEIDLSADAFRHPGPSYIRQLTSYEYMQTVRDLTHMEEIPFDRLGIDQSFPKESHEFVNQSLGMTLSVDTFDRYLRAGEEIAKQLLGDDSGVWAKIGGSEERRARKSAEKAREEVLFVEPEYADDATVKERAVADMKAAYQILTKFASRAYRRPLEGDEGKHLMILYRRARQLEGSHEEGLRSAMAAVLASPHFLLRLEENQAPEGSREIYPVEAHELATRLSYFLWSSMPDEQLRAKADSGELLDEEVLLAEAERMLADPNAETLSDHFAYQWLQLKLMDLPSLPTRRGFSKLTDEVEEAFPREIRAFFEHMRTEDASILDFLDSDYTFVNKELAKFYDLKDPSAKKAGKDEMVRVALRPEDHRGGLLGMGGVLWMTSHESRTKPTARGTWILEVVLGTPPPPPPPEAGSFSPPEEGQPEPETFRQKLEQHAQDAACIGCHRKIDPLGFALENFDPIGMWRQEVSGEPVDNYGSLPSGETFSGFEEMREVIKDRKDMFVRNFISQMLSYALGRELLYSDRGTVDDIARRVRENDYRFSEVVKGIVMSRPFRYRVNQVEPAGGSAGE